MIDITSDVLLDFNNIIEPQWSNLLTYLNYDIAVMDAASVRQNIVKGCKKPPRLWRCLGMYIIDQVARQNISLARELVFKILPRIYGQGISISREQFIQHKVIPVLQSILKEHSEIICEKCFDWQKVAPFNQPLKVMALVQNLDAHLGNDSGILKLDFSFLQRFELKSQLNLDKIGTIATMAKSEFQIAVSSVKAIFFSCIQLGFFFFFLANVRQCVEENGV